MILKCTHDAGFFSCCTILLKSIIKHFNKFKTLPSSIDSSQQFTYYKCPGLEDKDIRLDYFLDPQVPPPFLIPHYVDHEDNDDQFQDYKGFDYIRLQPFIDTYFHPSPEIDKLIRILLLKYNLTDPQKLKNVCVLFYRGNDKVKETTLCSYSEMIEKAKEIQLKCPSVQFLVQSDETEFLETMLQEFPNHSFCFGQEIRHMNRTRDMSVDHVKDKRISYCYSKWFLAIIIVMSYCGHIICTSGNCSIWIMYFRRNADNVHQYLDGKWV